MLEQHIKMPNKTLTLTVLVMNKRTFRFLSSRQNIPFQPTRKWCFFHVVSSKQCKENKLSCMFHSSSVIKTCYLILLQALEETHDSTFRGTQHDLRHFLRFLGIGCQHWSSERKCDSCTVIRVICIIGDTHLITHLITHLLLFSFGCPCNQWQEINIFRA